MTDEQLKEYRDTLVREIEYAEGRKRSRPMELSPEVNGQQTGLKWALKWLDEIRAKEACQDGDHDWASGSGDPEAICINCGTVEPK